MKTVWLRGTLVRDPQYAGGASMRIASLLVSVPYPDNEPHEPIGVEARARHCAYLQRHQPLKGDEIMLQGRIGRNADGDSVVIATAIGLDLSTGETERP